VIPTIEEISDALGKAVNQAADHLGRDDRGHLRVQWTEYETWRDAHGYGFPDQVKQPNASATIQEQWERIADLDAVRELRKALKPFERKLLPYLGERSDGDLVDKWFVVDALASLLNCMESGAASPTIADEAKAIHLTISKHSHWLTAIALLWGVDFRGADEIGLEDSVTLRRLTLSERQDAFPRHFDSHSHIGFAATRWAIETTVDHAEGVPDYTAAPKALFDAVAFALQMVKGGNICYDRVVMKRSNWLRDREFTVIVRRPLYIPSGRVEFDRDDVTRLKEVWARMQPVRKPLRAAVSRYMDATLELYPEDKLIDSVIALEATLTSDSTEQITYRLSLRGAILLESDPSARPAMIRKLKDAYGARSGLVHGSTLEYGTRVDPEEVHALAGKALRALILQGDGRAHDRLLHALDEYLVARGSEQTFEEYLKAHPVTPTAKE